MEKDSFFVLTAVCWCDFVPFRAHCWWLFFSNTENKMVLKQLVRWNCVYAANSDYY